MRLERDFLLTKEQKREREAEEARKDPVKETRQAAVNAVNARQILGFLRSKQIIPWVPWTDQEKERDKTGGLGGHWVPPSSVAGSPDGPTRSGGGLCGKSTIFPILAKTDVKQVGVFLAHNWLYNVILVSLFLSILSSDRSWTYPMNRADSI